MNTNIIEFNLCASRTFDLGSNRWHASLLHELSHFSTIDQILKKREDRHRSNSAWNRRNSTVSTKHFRDPLKIDVSDELAPSFVRPVIDIYADNLIYPHVDDRLPITNMVGCYKTCFTHSTYYDVCRESLSR